MKTFGFGVEKRIKNSIIQLTDSLVVLQNFQLIMDYVCTVYSSLNCLKLN